MHSPSAKGARIVPRAALVVLLSWLLPVHSGAQTPDTSAVHDAERGTLQVTGQGNVSVPPDQVQVALAVETEAPTASEAGQENARRMQEVMDALRGDEPPGLRLETYGYQLQPRYAPTRGVQGEEPRIVGYRALHHLRVTVNDPDAAGRLIDLGIDAGANRVAGLRFQLQDPDPPREAALREATRRARRQAEVLAEALEVTLGPPEEVTMDAPEAGKPASTARTCIMKCESPGTRNRN